MNPSRYSAADISMGRPKLSCAMREPQTKLLLRSPTNWLPAGEWLTPLGDIGKDGGVTISRFSIATYV